MVGKISKKELEKAKKLVEHYFKDEAGNPFKATRTQLEVFWSIFTIKYPRLAFLAMTRYGKSEIVAMAILLRSLVFKELFVIGANSKELAQILMDKCINHLSDHPIFEKNLVLEFKNLTKKLQKRESKSEFTWVDGGGVKTVTLSATQKKSEIEAVIGKGTKRLILEESSAIPNNIVGMAMRMLGDNAEDNFCLKLGNALYLNHFAKSVRSKEYKSYVVDYRQAIKEKRTTENFVQEMKEEMIPRQFKAMYECKFPDPEEIDSRGYFALLKENDFCEKRKKHFGEKRLGFDPSEGRDQNAGILRSDTKAEVAHRSNISDLMTQTKILTNLIEKYKLKVEYVSNDGTGVGAGISDRLIEMGFEINDVKWGASAGDSSTYANLKAENYFALRKWVINGGYIANQDLRNELLTIRWKENTAKKIMIKTKKEYAEDGVPSQNLADALALTFNEPKLVNGNFGAVWI